MQRIFFLIKFSIVKFNKNFVVLIVIKIRNKDEMKEHQSFFFLVFIVTILSCNQKNQKNIDSNIHTAAVTSNGLKLNPMNLDTLQTEDQIITGFAKRKSDVIALLSKSSVEEGNMIFESFRKRNDSALILLETKQQELLNDYVKYSDYDPVTEIYSKKFPPEIEETVEKFGKAGIEFWEIGEGYTELRMIPDYNFQIFNGRLTPDYQSYLEIITQEDKVLFQADAGIIIPWRDVAQRVEVREQFLNNFPDSKLTKKVFEELKEYQHAYLLGYDNTPTHEKGELYPENIAEYKRFVKANPKSKTTRIIKELLIQNLSAKKPDGDKIYEFVMKRIDTN